MVSGKKVWVALNMANMEVVVGSVRGAVLLEIGVTERRYLVAAKRVGVGPVTMQAEGTVWRIEQKVVLMSKNKNKLK